MYIQFIPCAHACESNSSTYMIHIITLPKTNIARENRPSQKEGSLPTFSGNNEGWGPAFLTGREYCLKYAWDSWEHLPMLDCGPSYLTNQC